MTTLVSIRELARALGVSPRTVRRWAATGDIPTPRGTYQTSSGPQAAYTPTQASFTLLARGVPRKDWPSWAGSQGVSEDIA